MEGKHGSKQGTQQPEQDGRSSQKELTVVPRFSLTKPTPSDITLPAGQHHLSLLSQTAPQTGDHVFQTTEPVGDILRRDTTEV